MRVNPIALTDTVTFPGLIPETVVTNCPLESVEPVAGLNETPPPPTCDRVTGMSAATFPPASLTSTVSVPVDEPLSGRVVAIDVKSTVDPEIKIGICNEMLLEVAVIVAVLDEISEKPDEKSTDA